MAHFIEEPFTVISTHNKYELSCIFHRKKNPYIDNQNREHVVILCHGYMAHKNAGFLPELSREISDPNMNQYHSVRFDFHGCGDSTGRDKWDYGGYENEAKEDLRCVVEYIRNKNEKYFIRALIGHSRAGTTILLYASYYDDIPILVNIAGRYRLERGIRERFSKSQLDELNKNGSFIIHTSTYGDFCITKEAIERRKNVNVNQYEKIRHAKVLHIWGDKDSVIPNDDIYLFNDKLKGAKKTEMIIVEDADHCFVGKEKELIKHIQPWIQQSID